MAAYLLRKLYDPEMTTNLAQISDIIRYTASWFGPYFAFGRAMLGFVDVYSFKLYIAHIKNNISRFKKEMPSVLTLSPQTH